MIIDSHQHFWRYQPARDLWITDEMAVLKRDFLPDDLMPELRANSVAGCISVQADQSEQETHFLLELAERHDEVKGVVGWVDLLNPGVRDRLRYWSQFRKLCGFRHVVQAEPDDRFLLRPEFLRGITALEEFDFTYDILIYPKQLPAAIELVVQFPRQRFVVDHLAKPEIRGATLEPWAQRISTLARNANVYAKLSGLVTEADWRNWRADDFRPYLDVVFAAFGPDRLMFGSDWPVCLLAGSYCQVKDLISSYTSRFGEDRQARIFAGNAIRFYRLKHRGNGSRTTQ